MQTRRGRGAFVSENGVAAAQRASESAVKARFVQGVRLGRAAGLPDERLRRIFTESLMTRADVDRVHDDEVVETGGRDETDTPAVQEGPIAREPS
jgi:hypothetical protein